MTLTEAKALRDEIRSRGYHCIVPLGHGPAGYFARIFRTAVERIDFHDRASFRSHHARRLWKRRAFMRTLDQPARARSPIESMVARACGLEKP